MIQFDPHHRITAAAERADIEALYYAEGRLKQAAPRPSIEPQGRSGLIRGILFGAAVLVIVSILAHVVLADPLARLDADIERGRAEYCGAC